MSNRRLFGFTMYIQVNYPYTHIKLLVYECSFDFKFNIVCIPDQNTHLQVEVGIHNSQSFCIVHKDSFYRHKKGIATLPFHITNSQVTTCQTWSCTHFHVSFPETYNTGFPLKQEQIYVMSKKYERKIMKAAALFYKKTHQDFEQSWFLMKSNVLNPNRQVLLFLELLWTH